MLQAEANVSHYETLGKNVSEISKYSNIKTCMVWWSKMFCGVIYHFQLLKFDPKKA